MSDTTTYLVEEGFSQEAIAYALDGLRRAKAEGKEIAYPNSYARKIAEGYNPGSRHIGCEDCQQGWMAEDRDPYTVAVPCPDCRPQETQAYLNGTLHEYLKEARAPKVVK